MNTDEVLNKLDADLKVDAFLESALKGDKEAIELLIEPIGNDDDVTKAFIELIALARVDDTENPSSTYYSPKVAHVRNDCRIKAFAKLTKLADKYYEEVLSNV